MDVLSQIPLGLNYGYCSSYLAVIIVFLPFAFAYFMEMQNEMMKIQGSKFLVTQWMAGSTRYERLVVNQTIIFEYSSHSILSNWLLSNSEEDTFLCFVFVGLIAIE